MQFKEPRSQFKEFCRVVANTASCLVVVSNHLEDTMYGYILSNTLAVSITLNGLALLFVRFGSFAMSKMGDL